MNLKISKATIIRTVTLFIVLINMVLKKFGISIIEYDENKIASVIETLIEIGAIVCAWWYNNSFSSVAKKADSFMKALKSTEREV